jgi:hypothetical protein
MVVDFILLLIEGALALVEHLFLRGRASRKGRVRKSLERRKAQRPEDSSG